MWRKYKMLATTLAPPPHYTAQDPAATAGGSAYSAGPRSELHCILIYGPASVRKHKLVDLFKHCVVYGCHFSTFYFYREKNNGSRAAQCAA